MHTLGGVFGTPEPPSRLLTELHEKPGQSCVRQVVQKRFAMASVMFLCSAEAGRFFIPT
jgi:hypothetical protein